MRVRYAHAERSTWTSPAPQIFSNQTMDSNHAVTRMNALGAGQVGILGFGVDGKCVAEFLRKQPDVTGIKVFDDESFDLPTDVEKGETLEGIDLLFRSPGFPLTHPLVKEAKTKGIPITSSTTYFLQHCPSMTIGVTGSCGKTTCVALIAEMLKVEFPPSLKLRGAGGEDRVERGGNDGVPRLDLLCHAEEERSDVSKRTAAKQPLSEDDFVVLELSSFQLIDCPVSPNVAVVLNISPNHLDWHKDMNEYREAKRQIVAHQKEGDIAVLNPNDAAVKKFAEGAKSEVRWFDDLPDCEILCKTHPDTIRAAVTTSRALGVSEKNIDQVLATFPGVPHRLEFIREVDGVSYYNDSSCTTPESAITACNAFPEGSVVLLLGGRDKGMDFSRLYEVIKKRDVAVVPYGEMAETFEENVPISYKLPAFAKATAGKKAKTSFGEAIEAARQVGRSNVVLSPACASFDMFQNAKERGERFVELLRSI